MSCGVDGVFRKLQMKKMEQADMEEREISIADLLVEILLHWRIMLIWMIVGAAALGALSYVRSGNAIEQQQVQTGGMTQNPEAWLTEKEMQNAKYVAGYEKMYFEKAAYQEESPLMQMDSNKVNRADAIIAIVTDDHELSHDIKRYMKILRRAVNAL